MFQFLIGRLKTSVERLIDLLMWSFNSLQVGSKLRGDRHELIQKLSFNSLQVGSKLPQFFPYSHMMIEFQFLIGRLKTLRFYFSYSSVLCFNSLQVGSKLKWGFFDYSCRIMFQFLIGRLKTIFLLILLLPFSSVSIPYRQSQKKNNQTTGNSLQYGFQFLIGRLKTRYD